MTRVCVIALLATLACQENAGQIAFKPSYSPPLPVMTYLCSKDPRKPDQLHVKLTADSQVFEQTIRFADQVVQFDVPIGAMRQIEMDVLNPQGCKLYTGTRSTIGFAEGDNGTLTVTMKPPAATPGTSYADQDHDGLNRCTEDALGTKDTTADSDRDGFDDFCEVTGGAGVCTDPASATSHPPASARCAPSGVPDGGADP
jgi:hypothetical protein